MKDSTLTDSKPSRRAAIDAFWWALLALAVTGAIVASVYRRPTKHLPVLRKLPDFESVDQQGEPFGTDDLEGRVWVGSFIFTRCRNACPGMTAEMTTLQSAVLQSPALRARVRLVSFSVDPTHDTPQKLAEFARAYGAVPTTWRFLTGDRSSIVRLCEEGFCLAAGGSVDATGASTGPVHSNRFSLVDGEGRVRGTYRPSVEPADLESLLKDLKLLVCELEDPAGG